MFHDFLLQGTALILVVVKPDGVSLRRMPSQKGEAIGTLTVGEELFVICETPPVIEDGYTWFYVQTPLGNGWIRKT